MKKVETTTIFLKKILFYKNPQKKHCVRLVGNSSGFRVSLTKNSETSQAPPHTLAIEFSTSLLGDEDNVLTSSPSLAWERMGQQFEPRAEHFLDEFADSLDTGVC